jgi:hypothetical protein
MKKIRAGFSLATGWRYLSSIAIVGGLLALLLFTQLSNLPKTYTQREQTIAGQSSSLAIIANKPVLAPYKLGVFTLSKITHNTQAATRIVAALVGAATLVLFYVGAQQWYTHRVGFLVSVLFACSSWFLFTARSGTGVILYAFTTTLLALAAYGVIADYKPNLSTLLLIAAVGLSVFLPGMLIVLILLGIINWRFLGQILSSVSTGYMTLLILLVVLLIGLPLGYVASTQPSYLLTLLGLPHTMPDIAQFGRNVAQVPASLFVWAPSSASLLLRNVPYVDIFTAVMFVLGIYYLIRHRGLQRALLIAVFLVVSWLLVALKAGANEVLLLVPVYVVAGAGLSVFLDEWLTTFPTNPLAKSFGILLVTAAVIASCTYNVRMYFVAWPSSHRVSAQEENT